MHFGVRLNLARKERKLTLEKLASLCNTSETVLRNYEKSRRFPNIEMLARLCNALKVSPNYLLQDDLTYSFEDETNELLSIIQLLSPSQKDFLMNFVHTLKGDTGM